MDKILPIDIMSKINISVVIPCYKQAHFLSDAIESVLEQSYKASEIIVVNDGSPDNASEVARRYPVRLVEKSNGGLASARNAGIRIANGDHIMCLDSDDMLRSDALKEHSKLADGNSIVTCGLSWFGNETGTFRPQGATLESLLKHNTVYCNSLFPRSAWIDTGGFDESPIMRLGLEDWLIWIEMAGKGYVFKTNEYIGLLYRKHGDNMTKRTTHPNWEKITDYMVEKTKNLRK